MDISAGGCLCGAIRFEAKGRPLRVGLCHCMDCRKFHGALFHASAIFLSEAVTIQGDPGDYRGRFFCPRCGSSVFGRSGDEIELHLGAFDAPDQFKPTYELWTIRRESWLPHFPNMTLHARDREAETLAAKIARVLADRVEIAPYDPNWPALFEAERAKIAAQFPSLITRIEHYGSTAVPGLAAKPVIDMLIEVRTLVRAQAEIAPALEAEGYDYFWRPTHGDDGPPFYCWFIKRDRAGARTHHLHMVEVDFPQWRQLEFRDALRADPARAAAYEALKRKLAAAFAHDREAYTEGKGAFVEEILATLG